MGGNWIELLGGKPTGTAKRKSGEDIRGKDVDLAKLNEIVAPTRSGSWSMSKNDGYDDTTFQVNDTSGKKGGDVFGIYPSTNQIRQALRPSVSALTTIDEFAGFPERIAQVAQTLGTEIVRPVLGDTSSASANAIGGLRSKSSSDENDVSQII